MGKYASSFKKLGQTLTEVLAMCEHACSWDVAVQDVATDLRPCIQ